MRPDVERAVGLLQAGELVAIPTETVYGLGADAANPRAVARIFAVKGRPADHPLIVHIPGVSHLDRWARDVPEAARVLANKFWPGPLTLILKRQPAVSDVITGGQNTVGLRVPNHPLALELLTAFDGGIAAPSANRFGRISPTTAEHVRDDLGATVPLILDGGPCTVGIESTIVDLSGPQVRVLRPGMLSADTIGALLGERPPLAGADQAPITVRASGMLEAHYAPRTPLLLLTGDNLPGALQQALLLNETVAVLAPLPAPFDHPRILWHQAAADAATYAHDLYATLRHLDALACDRIVVQQPEGPDWQAVVDRLRRAAAGSGS